ncbi:MAG: SDR family oxidoreductase [Chloroflexi bacterium]|nr:SDR family oxidoreductase [Chloroflexota bacterium]
MPEPRLVLPDLFDLSGKVAFIAGGYGGIGQVIAQALAARGARVAIAGRRPERTTSVARALSDAGHIAFGLGFDVRNASEIHDAVSHVVDEFGGLDILVNCVGIQREEPLLDVAEAAFDAVYALSLKAAMFLGQAVARHQVAVGRGGRQVHLLSVRAQLGLRGRGYSAYVASKGDLAALIRQHAVELAPCGITVNGVAPTFVDTAMVRTYLDDPVFRGELEARISLGRIAQSRDVVGPVTFFVSPADL